MPGLWDFSKSPETWYRMCFFDSPESQDSDNFLKQTGCDSE